MLISYTRGITTALILISSLAYFGSVALFAQNVPSYDDFVDVLPFVIALTDEPTLSQSMALIFEQYNQHFIVTNRLIYTLMYRLSGEINFYYLILIANLNIALLGFLYCKHAQGSFNLLLAAISCVLLFQLRYFHTALWAMAALANFSAAALTLLSLSLLGQGSRLAFLGAILSAFLAVFSLGSGIFVLFGGVLVLAIEGIKSANFDKLRTALWVLFSALTIILFFSFYDVGSLNNDTPPPYNANVDFPFKDIVTFIALIGSPLAFDHPPSAVIAGVCILCLYVFCCARGAWRRSVLFAFSLCLLMALGVLTQQRSWAEIQLLIETERYRFVALNFGICVLLLSSGALSVKSRYLYPSLLILAIGFSMTSYWSNFNAMIRYSEETAAGIAHWQNTGRGGKLRKPVWVDLTVPFQNLEHLYATGVYRPDRNVSNPMLFTGRGSVSEER